MRDCVATLSNSSARRRKPLPCLIREATGKERGKGMSADTCPQHATWTHGPVCLNRHCASRQAHSMESLCSAPFQHGPVTVMRGHMCHCVHKNRCRLGDLSRPIGRCADSRAAAGKSAIEVRQHRRSLRGARGHSELTPIQKGEVAEQHLLFTMSSTRCTSS